MIHIVNAERNSREALVIEDRASEGSAPVSNEGAGALVGDCSPAEGVMNHDDHAAEEDVGDCVIERRSPRPHTAGGGCGRQHLDLSQYLNALTRLL